VTLCYVVAVVEAVWDPLSMQQTRRLTGLVQRLIDDYPTISADSKPTQVVLVDQCDQTNTGCVLVDQCDQTNTVLWCPKKTFCASAAHFCCESMFTRIKKMSYYLWLTVKTLNLAALNFRNLIYYIILASLIFTFCRLD